MFNELLQYAILSKPQTSNQEINSFKRIDFSTNKMGTNHFSPSSSILKPSTGLEIYTRPLVFTSSLWVRTSENCYWLALSDE